MSWSARKPGLPGGTVLRGRHAVLTPLAWPEPADALAAAMLAEDPSLWTYMTIGPFADRGAFLDMLRQRTDDGIRFMAISAPEGPPLGFAAFMRVRPDDGSAEIGSVAFGRHLQRSRMGTEAIFLMLEELFGTYGWRRAEWQCNAENARSARAGERYGFVYEGRFRQDKWVKGRNRDTLWFSILDSEWPDCRVAFEAWLADDNFTPDGRQKRSLAEIREGLSSFT